MERRSVLMLALVLAAPPAAAQISETAGRQSMNDDVRMALALDAPPAQGQVRLRVELENRGTKVALVPRAVATMDRLLGNVFTVTEEGGLPVAYQGPMVKRGPLTAADYLALQPGQRHVHRVDIGPAYAFRPGTHTYAVSYAGHYLTDARALAGGGNPGFPLAAPPVTFTYTP